MATSPVRKAIIPAAGLGTRFLPATKSVPKEMLPIVDLPILHFALQEAADAGIEEIILITGRQKRAVEEYLAPAVELESHLSQVGRLQWLKPVLDLRERLRITPVQQEKAMGLGHAVLCGRAHTGKEAFAVLLPDEVCVAHPGQAGATAQLVQAFMQSGRATVGVIEVPEDQVSRYGIVRMESSPVNQPTRILGLIEKPNAGQAPSRWALPGRYVFTADLMQHLSETRPGKNGEIQLTDAMLALAREQSLDALALQQRRYDAGDKLGYLIANIELGLLHSEIGAGLRAYLRALQL